MQFFNLCSRSSFQKPVTERDAISRKKYFFLLFFLRKFIGLSLHPVYGGHFAFRSVLIFPNVRIPEFCESVPRPILTEPEDVRAALEKFNYNWKDSGFRDFGNPSRRYSTTQMEFFGRPVAERWEVLRPWIDGGAKNID
ncbi:hypothetical protein GCK72_005926 [Caenorhabditis remanei]|uniref:Cyanocobalamin reductase (cyanide-eliminating) n=1 Tax=Caenorhabditis remanei TaxID=31234 RepID=A0A6A5HJ31_CAERE|nr:hypothetical protein GCK72_005926 [Caenorhabditis remanei]KAF1765972.1 hypothetical protein GCK72_005926 [Caenorhabditis remanei]